MNSKQLATRLRVTDEQLKDSEAPESNEVYGCIYALGVNLLLGTPIYPAISLAGFETSNPQLLRFFEDSIEALRSGFSFEQFFEDGFSTSESILSIPKLKDAFLNGESDGSLGSHLVDWAEPNLEEDWHFKHLMQGQEWQRSFFTRMKELYLEEFTFEESLKKYLGELQEQGADRESFLYRNVLLILRRVNAGQSYIEGLSRVDNPFSTDISPIILNWNAAGVAAMKMDNVYKYLCPKKV